MRPDSIRDSLALGTKSKEKRLTGRKDAAKLAIEEGEYTLALTCLQDCIELSAQIEELEFQLEVLEAIDD